MRYISTRGDAPDLGFEDAMLTGLARDGGLYVPETVPTMSAGDIAALAGLPYEEVAFRVMRPFVGDTFTDAELPKPMQGSITTPARLWCNLVRTISCWNCSTAPRWRSKTSRCS